MKTTINKLLVFVALILAACSSTPSSNAPSSNAPSSNAPKKYTVEGIFSDEILDEEVGIYYKDLFNDLMVYLLDYETNKYTDSAKITDGKFTFTGSVDIPVIRGIMTINGTFGNIILENGNITIDISFGSEKEPVIKGTPLNDKLGKINSEMRKSEKSDREKMEKIQFRDGYEIQREIILNNYYSEIEPLLSKNFNANKNNALGTFVLLLWANILTPEKFDSLYMEAGEVVRNYKLLKDIIEKNEKDREMAEIMAEMSKKTAVGMMFTDFTIENGNIDGSKVSFSDYIGKGKYVLVDFWASWCGPCIAEIPMLKDIYNTYKGAKFEILGVAVSDKRENTIKAIEDHKVPWSQIIDANNIPISLYNIVGIPQIMLFDPNGIIIARDLRGNALKAKIAEVMNQ